MLATIAALLAAGALVLTWMHNSPRGSGPTQVAVEEASGRTAELALRVPPTADYQLGLLGPDGEPLAGAIVVLGPDTLLGSGGGIRISDADGLSRFSQVSNDRTAMLIWPVGFAPREHVRAVAAGTEWLQIERGVAITGIVRIDGVPPSWPMELELVGSLPFDEEPPSTARAWMRAVHALDRRIAVTTTALDGRFAFGGLSAGADYLVRLPPGFSSDRDSAERVEVRRRAPTEQVDIDVTRVPAVFGQIVRRRFPVQWRSMLRFEAVEGLPAGLMFSSLNLGSERLRIECTFEARDGTVARAAQDVERHDSFMIPFALQDIVRCDLGVLPRGASMPVLAERSFHGDPLPFAEAGRIDLDQ